jgi:hypothetical protein
VSAVRELAPGIHHWTAFHPGIGMEVSSYWVEPAAALIDPMLPAEGLEWWEGRPRPERILLSIRHHYRDSSRFVETFGCEVLCSEHGLHEFEGTDRDVRGYAWGEEVAPGITALEVGAICPDEAALHVAVAEGALACADGVVRWRGDDELAFVPDSLLGDDPEAVKEGLLASYRSLLERDFAHLLLAHGLPIVGEGKEALAGFAGARPS